MGERDHFISMEMAAIGMEMMAEWGTAAIVQRLAILTERIAQGVRGIGVSVPRRHLRAPHVLSLAFRNGMPKGLGGGAASGGIFGRGGLGRMRIFAHGFNDETGGGRLGEAFVRRPAG